MNKISTVAAATLISVSAVVADTQVISVENGWNLVGTKLDNVNVTDNFKDVTGLQTVWKYENNAWKAYSPNTTLAQKISDHQDIGNLQTLNAGDGFWVYTASAKDITLEGDTAASSKLSISNGWQLLSPKESQTLSTDYFNKPEVTSVWKWNAAEEKWYAYSPQDNLNASILKTGDIGTLISISEGNGFWVNASGEATDLVTPPQIGAALLMQSKLNAIPLAQADLYIDGEHKGKTKQNGTFDLSGVQDGAKVEVKKQGTTAAYGTVKGGKVVLVAQYDDANKVNISDLIDDGTAKPIEKAITSKNGKAALKVKTMGENNENKDITVSVTPFQSTTVAPKLNDLTDGTKADQMAIIGGAFLNVENTNGEKLALSDMENDTFDMNLEVSEFLGDLEDILNGNTKTPSDKLQKFGESAYNQLEQLITNGAVSLKTLQWDGEKWVGKGKAHINKFTKPVKDMFSGEVKEITKYKISTNSLGDATDQDVALTKMAPTAFVMKMEYLTGETQICATEAGYKMFDGTVMTKPQNDADDFEWLNDEVSFAVLLGDDTVTSGPDMTAENGCATVTYKVPFLSPNFSISLKKDGYYDTMVSCEANVNSATCSDAKMHKIPDTATVAGHVYDKQTNNGIDDALVTLVNPEVLSADKIEQTFDENGTSIVKVGYHPNVTYTWTATKTVQNDDNTTKDITIGIKTDSGTDFAQLSEAELMNTLVAAFDDPDNNAVKDAGVDNPTGQWDLHVKAVQTFSNTDTTLTEEAVGSFNIDILMPKLAQMLTGTINQGYDESVTSLAVNPDYQTEYDDMQSNAKELISVYGGSSIGMLYTTGGANLANFQWSTQLLAAATDSCDLDDPQYIENDICLQKVVEEPFVLPDSSLYPFGVTTKYMAKYFTDLLKPDTHNNDKPFYQSGATIRVMAQGDLTGTVADDDLNTETVVLAKQKAASYTDLPENDNSLTAFVDIPDISLVGASATAYMRQTVTEDDGSYYINMVPPELNEKLKIFAKASGYKFANDPDFDSKLVNDLQEGQISTYDLYLNPVNSDNPGVMPQPIIEGSFDDYNLSSKQSSWCAETSQWQVITDANVSSISGVKGSLLADNNTTTSGYLWFGNPNNGTLGLNDNGYGTTVCGQAKSASYDFSDFAFPVLNFKTWFEVESVDVAKGMFDQMKIGFIYNGSESVTVPMINGEEKTLEPGEFYSVEQLNPGSEPSIQSSSTGYSSAGLGMEPVWIDAKVPMEFLAGLSDIQFVFDFHSVDSLYNNWRGWGVDTIAVKESMTETLMTPPATPALPGTVEQSSATGVDETQTLEKAMR